MLVEGGGGGDRGEEKGVYGVHTHPAAEKGRSINENCEKMAN